MSESQEEITPKKSIGWKLAIGLSLIFIILVASVAYLAVTLVAAQNSYENTLKALQTENGQLQASNTDLQNQVDNLTAITDMRLTTTWADIQLNASQTWSMQTQADYAGYAVVSSSSANPSNMSITLSYTTSKGVNYNTTAYNGWEGAWENVVTWFPILPSDVNISITVISGSTSVPVEIGYVY